MLMKKYIEYLKENTELSENTISSYIYDIDGYLNYCGYNEIKDVSNESLTAYIIHLKNSGRSMSTIMRFVSAVKNFTKYLSDSGEIDSNPCENIELPKYEKKPIEARISCGDLDLLLDSIKRDSLKGMRDYAMICLVASSGIRASEITELNLDNFNARDMLIEVIKNGCKQFYPLSDEVFYSIEKYVKSCRPLIVSDNENALFVNTNGKRMTRQGFWKIIRMYKEKAAIKSPVTPRSIRYSMPG